MEGPGSSVFAWCPITGGNRKGMLVTGSAEEAAFGMTGGGLFADVDEHTPQEASSLQIWEMNMAAGKLEKKAEVVTQNLRFERVCWSKAGGENGLIAGATTDGKLRLWSVDSVLKSKGEATAPVATINHKNGNAITCMDFTTNLTPSCIAAAGKRGIVSVYQLKDPERPLEIKIDQSFFEKNPADVTDILFNPFRETILGTATIAGTINIWDLRQAKRVAVQLQAQGPYSYTTISWNSFDIAAGTCGQVMGLQHSPSPIHIWDIRQPRVGKAMLEGHTGGVVSLSWSPLDPSLLVSTAQDGRCMMWDPYGAPGEQLTNDLPVPPGKTLSAKWHSKLPLLAIGAASEGKLQVKSMHSLNPAGSASECRKAPYWLRRPVGATFAFGGRLAMFTSNYPGKDPNDPHPPPNPLIVTRSAVPPGALLDRAQELDAVLYSEDPSARIGYCEGKATQAREKKDKGAETVWSVLATQCSPEPRKSLQKLLGILQDDTEEKLDQDSEGVSPEDSDELAILALLTGNALAAHKWLTAGHRLPDTLVLACHSGMWEEAKKSYYSNTAPSRPASVAISHMVMALVEGFHACSEMLEAVAAGKPGALSWKQALALIAVASAPEELSQHCESLAQGLSKAGVEDALFCWMSAGNLERVVEDLVAKYQGEPDSGVQELVEMVSIMEVVFEGACNNELYLDLQCRYASALAANGADGAYYAFRTLHMVPATHEASTELRWRISNSQNYGDTSIANPFPPFELQYVEPDVPERAETDYGYSHTVSPFAAVAPPPAVPGHQRAEAGAHAGWGGHAGAVSHVQQQQQQQPGHSSMHGGLPRTPENRANVSPSYEALAQSGSSSYLNSSGHHGHAGNNSSSHPPLETGSFSSRMATTRQQSWDGPVNTAMPPPPKAGSAAAQSGWQQPGHSASQFPPQTQHGLQQPPQHGQQPGHNASQFSSAGMPPHGMQQQPPQHNMHQPPQHGMHQQSRQGMQQQQPQHGMQQPPPPSNNMHQPPQHSMQQPPQHSMQQPPQHSMQQPPQHGMHQPPQHGMQQPPQHGMQQPPQHGMQQPPQHGMQQPPQHGMQQPPQHGMQQPPPSNNMHQPPAQSMGNGLALSLDVSFLPPNSPERRIADNLTLLYNSLIPQAEQDRRFHSSLAAAKKGLTALCTKLIQGSVSTGCRDCVLQMSDGMVSNNGEAVARAREQLLGTYWQEYKEFKEIKFLSQC